MKKEDVPQQTGLGAGQTEVNYAVDADGNYTLTQSCGWEAKTIALRQAWEAIVDQLQEVLTEIKAGKKSPLAYHMIKNQMDVALLAQYSGIAKWRVKRHLTPEVFARLKDVALAPYAQLFDIELSQLRTVPGQPDLKPFTPDNDEVDTK